MSEDDEDIVPLREVEKRAILDAIAKLGGNKLEAARRLGIGKTTIYRRLKEYEDDAAFERMLSQGRE